MAAQDALHTVRQIFRSRDSLDVHACSGAGSELEPTARARARVYRGVVEWQARGCAAERADPIIALEFHAVCENRGLVDLDPEASGRQARVAACPHARDAHAVHLL